MAYSQSSRSTSAMELRNDEDDEAVDAEDEGNDPPRVNEARRGEGTGIVVVELKSMLMGLEAVLELCSIVMSVLALLTASTGVTSTSGWNQGWRRICSSDGRSTGRYWSS